MTIIDSSDIKDTRELLSQTPPNYSQKNYFLYELQQKVDADWRYRPNRALIEIEKAFGSEKFRPLEVVLQTVKSEKGEVVSNDWRKVVFKDISQQYPIGQRYRFDYDFVLNKPKRDKNVWIALNANQASLTSHQVICRCNGTLASIHTTKNNNNVIHYEPVILTTKLNSAGFQFSEVAIDPRGQLIVIAQNNEYTKQYYINQRFVIGTNKVYKLTNIINTDSQHTYQPEDAGIIRFYLDMDQISELDNFDTRLAYNGKKDAPVAPVKDGDYSLEIIKPTSVPEILTTLTFTPCVLFGNMKMQDIPISIECQLEGAYAHKANVDDFVRVERENNRFTLTRLKTDTTMSLSVTCKAMTYNGKELTMHFNMRLFGG